MNFKKMCAMLLCAAMTVTGIPAGSVHAEEKVNAMTEVQSERVSFEETKTFIPSNQNVKKLFNVCRNDGSIDGGNRDGRGGDQWMVRSNQIDATYRGAYAEFKGNFTSFAFKGVNKAESANFKVVITDDASGETVFEESVVLMKNQDNTTVPVFETEGLSGKPQTVRVYHEDNDGFYMELREITCSVMTEEVEMSEQQAYLTNWYRSMDSSKGYINLFEDELSYLTLARNSNSTDMSGWPSHVQMNGQSWEVRSTKTQNYDVSVMGSIQAGTKVRVSVGEDTIECTVPYTGPNRYQIGTIEIPEGTSTVTLTTENGSGTATQLELLPESGKEHYEQLLRETRERKNWMKENPIGAFYQYGEWGANADGSHDEWPACYENIDWDSFVKCLSDTGVDYLVWSISWSQYYIAAPIAAVDAVLPGRTSEVDYLQEILDACEKYGLETVFYYHAGWDSGMGHTPAKDWWDAMYRNDLPDNNHARKELFMDRWMNIVREIGERYGDQLDGWMFDYTNSYNIGPFEKMLEAARAGNPERMVTYNSYNVSGVYGPAYTPLMDFYMGEDNSYNPGGGSVIGGIPIRPADGRYESGPYADMESHFCFPAETGGSWGGWGIDRYAGISPVGPKFSQEIYNDVVLRAMKNKQALSFCFQMFEDGTVCEESYARLKKAVDRAKASLKVTEDTAEAVQYPANQGWTELKNELSGAGGCHETVNAGAECTFTFEGNNVTWIAETGPEFGLCEVWLDGSKVAEADLSAEKEHHQVTVYDSGKLTEGTHTLKLVNQSGKKICVDRLFTSSTPLNPPVPPGMHNDDAANYRGSWTTASGRSEDQFYQGDYRDANSDGDELTLDFYGDGIDVIGCRGSSEGTMEISVDDEEPVIVNCYSAQYLYKQRIFSRKGLEPGKHTLKMVRKSGSYVKVDGFEVFGDLSEMSADYSAVEKQKAIAAALIEKQYETESWEALQNVLHREGMEDLDITRQEEVDVWADEIAAAVDALVWIADQVEAESYHVTVTGGIIEGETDETPSEGNYAYDKKLTVKAKDSLFTRWEADGKVVSYDKEYTFYVSNDIALTAVYEEGAEAEAEVLVTNVITAKRPDGKYDVKFVGEIAAPEGCTIKNAGLVWSPKDGMELTLENVDVKKTYIKKISNTNQFSVTIKGMPGGNFLRGKIFATVVKDGTPDTIYSAEKKAVTK